MLVFVSLNLLVHLVAFAFFVLSSNNCQQDFVEWNEMRRDRETSRYANIKSQVSDGNSGAFT